MAQNHLAWRAIELEAWDRQAVAHLEACELCRQRLLKRLQEDMAFPTLPEPHSSALRARQEDLLQQALRALERWPRLSHRLRSHPKRSSRIQKLARSFRFPLAQIALQEARQVLRSDLGVARNAAQLALELLEDLEDPSYLLADSKAEAHLFLAELARRKGELDGWHLSQARAYSQAGTGCPVLEAEIHSASASYCVDVGDFRQALDHVDQAVEAFRTQRRAFPYAIALVKRASIMSLLDPEEGVLDARSALRWIARRGIRHNELETAALVVRIDCLVEAGRANEAYRLLNRHHRRLFPEDSSPLLAARMQFLGARLLFQLGLPREGELTLGGAIQALERVHPQEAFRARIVLLRHLAREKRWDEAFVTAQDASATLKNLRHPDPGALRTVLFLNLLGRGVLESLSRQKAAESPS